MWFYCLILLFFYLQPRMICFPTRKCIFLWNSIYMPSVFIYSIHIHSSVYVRGKCVEIYECHGEPTFLCSSLFLPFLFFVLCDNQQHQSNIDLYWCWRSLMCNICSIFSHISERTWKAILPCTIQMQHMEKKLPLTQQEEDRKCCTLNTSESRWCAAPLSVSHSPSLKLSLPHLLQRNLHLAIVIVNAIGCHLMCIIDRLILPYDELFELNHTNIWFCCSFLLWLRTQRAI